MKKLVIKGDWFDEEKFKKLKQIAADQTLQFWLNFTVLDPRKFPKTISDVENYGIEGINELVNFYVADKKDTYRGESVLQKANLDKITTLAEFEGLSKLCSKIANLAEKWLM